MSGWKRLSEALEIPPAPSPPEPVYAATIPWLDGPDLEPILELHRGPDGFVRFFVRKDDGDLQPVASIRVDTLRQKWLPGFLDRLSVDSYLTVNSFWKAGTSRTDDLRYLNACYVDLDYYRAGIERSDAIARLVLAQDEQVIPPASIIADSGRGMWAIFLLVSDQDAGLPPRAWPDFMDLYRAVQRAILYAIERTLPLLKPDRKAIDASRVTRVPGSFSRAGQRRVEWWIQGDSVGGFAYTLDQLADFFHVRQNPEPEPEPPPIIPGEQRRLTLLPPRRTVRTARPMPEKRKGWLRLMQKRIADLETLRLLRDGIPEGSRNSFLWIYTVTMRKMGARDGEVGEKLLELWRDCHQPPHRASRWFSKTEAGRYVETSRRWHKWSNRTLVEMLSITAEEQDELASIRLDQESKPVRRRSRAERNDRRRLIRQIIAERGGAAPSCRDLQVVLQERGVTVSFRTVNTDLRVLGFRPDPPA